MLGFWFLMVVGVLIGLGVGIGWFVYGKAEGSVGHMVAAILVGIVILVGTIGGGAFYRSTESGQRMEKTWESETEGGIERTVTVYDLNGNVIKEYTGQFDVDPQDNNCIMFDDENGKRHIIYYTTGTVIIDENTED